MLLVITSILLLLILRNLWEYFSDTITQAAKKRIVAIQVHTQYILVSKSIAVVCVKFELIRK